jgi:hypothetical protein
VHSEPGATAPNQIPRLLWETGKGSRVTSPNLLQLHAPLDNTAKANLESYLLAQLSRDSQFANIGYFVFLCLHRLERTIDALSTARKFLAGDKVFGYSNVLATFSAVISREHEYIDPNLFKASLESLEGDDEHDFRLREKLNLAQLQALDRQRTANGSPPEIPTRSLQLKNVTSRFTTVPAVGQPPIRDRRHPRRRRALAVSGLEDALNQRPRASRIISR